MSEEEPLRIVLTQEQREIIHRASGQHAEIIELSRDDESSEKGTAAFRWRLSAATGIPRQAWDLPEDPSAPPPKAS